MEITKKYYQSSSSVLGLFTRELQQCHRYSAQDNKPPRKQRKARSDRKISQPDDQNLSISRQLELSQTPTYKLLRKDLDLHPYKVRRPQIALGVC
ncbi:hypothetical protein FQA39_LY06657 [Lamprigera yunnana]|nr:hypothetical protein FQA39_LY06657 [Lamprigera yunnana]